MADSHGLEIEIKPGTKDHAPEEIKQMLKGQLEEPDGTPASLAPDKAAGCHRCRVGVVRMFRNFVVKSVLLEFEASTDTIEENENRIASEDNFYQLRLSLVVGRALSRRERIAGWRAAARRDGWRLAAHEGCGQSAGREQFS